MDLAKKELSDQDKSLPDPERLPFAPDEIEMLLELWMVWASTDKRYLPSQLIPELQAGYGRILNGLFDMDALYAKVLSQLKKQMPNGQ